MRYLLLVNIFPSDILVAERAIVEVPEEKTPLDRFIDIDEETKKKQLSILQESSEFMKKLNGYFDRKLAIQE